MTAAPLVGFSPWPDKPPLFDELIPNSTATITGEDILRAMEEMWLGPVLPFSAWRKPGTRMYGPPRFPATAFDRQREAAAWQRAGHSAWIESVRDKLQSAVYATDQGWSWTWDAPGFYGRPDLAPWVEYVRCEDAPEYRPEADR